MMDEKGFSQSITTETGYDYRDDPADQRGAHGLEFRFTLQGPNGAITWKVGTGWMSRPLDGAYVPQLGKQQRRDKPGVDRRLADSYPFAGAVFSHTPKPLHEYDQGPSECDILGGQCWGDSGYLVGDRVLEALIEDGEAGAFRELRDLYADWIGE